MKLGLGLLACALAAYAFDDAKIQRVENGLRPGVTIKGRAVPKWSILWRMANYKVPGVSVAVIDGGKIAWARGYGQTAAEGGKPVDAETLFQAASISKHVAALVALHLVDEGKLALDEDVNAKLRSWKVPENEFTQTEKVTLRRLLNHSAGLTVHGFRGYAADEPVPTLVQVLDGVKPANSAPVRVDVVPGTLWRYSGGGYEVMQQLVEDVTGKRLPELARTFVFEPLGMTHSTFEQPLPEARRGNAASGHRASGAVIRGNWHTYPEMAAAGLWTTPSDLARIALELESGDRVLKPETKQQMLTKLKGDYGLGLGLRETAGRASFAHGGSNDGFQCEMFAYRSGGQGAVVMTNGDRGGALAHEVMSAIADEYGWADYRVEEKTVAKVDPAVLRSYAGRYRLMPGLEVTVSAEGDRLFAEQGGEKAELFPESETSFFATEPGVPPIRFVAKDGAVEMRAGGMTAKKQ